MPIKKGKFTGKLVEGVISGTWETDPDTDPGPDPDPMPPPEGDHMSHFEYLPGIPDGMIPIPSDPGSLETVGLMSASRPWTHTMHGVDALHAAGHKGDKRVLIAVLDTGVQTVPTPHPDLAAVDYPQCIDFVGQGINDGNGHGTHCTGTVCGWNDAANRIMGVAPGCTVRHYKILSNQGSGTGGNIARAIRAVADLPGFAVRIISGSFGAGGEDPTITSAVKYAHSKGVIQIYAAGNSGPNSPNWPGMLEECIAIGACDPNGNVTPFSSSKDDYVDAVAGGQNVPSCYPGNRIAVMSGTSMATPLVAGIVGVAASYALNQAGRPPTDKEVKAALYSTCQPYGSGKDSRGGYGRVKGPEFAHQLAVSMAPVDPPKPPVDPPKPPTDVVRIAVPDGAKFVEVRFASA